MKKIIFLTILALAGLFLTTLSPNRIRAAEIKDEQFLKLSVSKVVGYASGIGKEH
jgi:hypothetical protein